jgi:anti-anti-sigma factor
VQILTEIFGDVLVAHAPDELTEDPARLLTNTVKRALEAGQVKVVLQMDRTDGFDSLGLSALADLQDQLRGAGGGMKVCGLTDSGRKVFQIVRFDRRFESFDSLIDAVGSFH